MIYSKNLDKLTDLQQHIYVKRIIELLKNHVKVNFSYGSLGTEKFHENSDVDLYIYSTHDVNQILDLLKNEFDECYTLEEKIVIWQDGQLIECVCINDINQAKYIPESPYIHASNRIFCATEDFVEELENIANTKTDIDTVVSRLRWRLYHLVKVIPQKEMDIFRLRFNSQIIEHTIVRWRAIKNGDITHNYLPRKAYDYISPEEWKMIEFSTNDEPKQYINRIKPFAHKILEEIDGLFPKI